MRGAQRRMRAGRHQTRGVFNFIPRRPQECATCSCERLCNAQVRRQAAQHALEFTRTYGSRGIRCDVLMVGRGRDNHIVIPEGYVSHHHAQIYRHGNQYVIEDLGSINHTYVNGQILEGRAYLRPGDKIRIGLVTLRFER